MSSAFTACSDTEFFSSNSTITYDFFPLNRGGDLDQASGVYTCPRSGLYLFSATLVSDDRGDFLYEDFLYSVMRNGEAVVSGVCHYYNQGGNVALVECEEGDEVWVETHSDITLFGEPGTNYACFTGAQIL